MKEIQEKKYIYIYKLSPYDIIYYPYEFAENEKCQFKFFFLLAKLKKFVLKFSQRSLNI